MPGGAFGEFVAAVIGEVVVKVIFRYPGAIVLWAITGFRKPYAYWTHMDRFELAAFAGIMAFAAVIILSATL